MKASELRIGNFIKSEVNHRKQMKVLQLFGDSFQGDFGDSSRGGIMYASSEGIPLTEEWLMKFGFTKHDFKTGRETFAKTYGINGVQFIIWRPEYNAYGFQLSDHKDVIVKTVHQLQNLFFVITGTELLLKGDI